MLTAEEFCKKLIPPVKGNDRNYYKRDSDVYKAMIEFAKMHVEAASKKLNEDLKSQVPFYDFMYSYPLTNIK